MTLTVANCGCNVREDFQARYSAVHLSAGVIGDDDSVAPDFVGFDGILHALDTFKHKWSPARDLLPLQLNKIAISE